MSRSPGTGDNSNRDSSPDSSRHKRNGGDGNARNRDADEIRHSGHRRHANRHRRDHAWPRREIRRDRLHLHARREPGSMRHRRRTQVLRPAKPVRSLLRAGLWRAKLSSPQRRPAKDCGQVSASTALSSVSSLGCRTWVQDFGAGERERTSAHACGLCGVPAGFVPKIGYGSRCERGLNEARSKPSLPRTSRSAPKWADENRLTARQACFSLQTSLRPSLTNDGGDSDASLASASDDGGGDANASALPSSSALWRPAARSAQWRD
jgi:hypothetical protein